MLARRGLLTPPGGHEASLDLASVVVEPEVAAASAGRSRPTGAAIGIVVGDAVIRAPEGVGSEHPALAIRAARLAQ
ncbi:MAG: hypothetical protein ACFCUS_03625 [Rubrimonas sp.]